MKKVSRNALCPCESGKKYKYCCLDKGFTWVEDEDGRIFKSIPMTKKVREIIDNQYGKFVRQVGREPGPNDRVFFDGPSEEDLEEYTNELFGALINDGFDPAHLYAYRRTGRFVTESNKKLLTNADLDEWDDAIDEFERVFERRTRWTASNINKLIANPLYAGIGPFPDGVLIEAIPRIIDDKTWIEAQLRRIDEVGVRQHLIYVRRSLHDSLGMKVAAIARPEWLNNSVSSIGEIGAEQFFHRFLSQLRPNNKNIEVVKTLVHLTNITPDLLKVLTADPNELINLSPDLFEELICDRLNEMGFGLERVGKHTYQKDGGIDIIAWPKAVKFPFLMAVQAKHHRSPRQKTAVGPVRDLLGAVHSLKFHVGVLVTNTTFTPDAKWVAEQMSTLIRLRDINDIHRWLQGDFLNEYDWREMPDEIEVCPGVIVRIPKE